MSNKSEVPWWSKPVSGWLTWPFKQVVERVNALGADLHATREEIRADIKAFRDEFERVGKASPPSIKMTSDVAKDK